MKNMHTQTYIGMLAKPVHYGEERAIALVRFEEGMLGEYLLNLSKYREPPAVSQSKKHKGRRGPIGLKCGEVIALVLDEFCQLVSWHVATEEEIARYG
jgi:hypothetical protein